jgi:hypothetical protein
MGLVMNTTAEDLIRQAEEALARPLRLPYQASAIATRLYKLSNVHQLADDDRVVALQQRFHDVLEQAELPNILGNQLEYASRLASAPGPLIYEEMHKLFALCDEIHALRSQGFRADDALVRQFEDDVRRRFAAQPKEAMLAAQYNVKKWNRTLWWYAENLDSTSE